MHISINTAEDISDLDRQVLGLLAGGSFILGEIGETDEIIEDEPVEDEPEPEEEPEPVRPAAKKAAAKKTAAKKAEPEPMAEEPLEEDGDEPDEEFDEDQPDEDLLALAVKKATEMVGAGEAPKVREALEAAGAARVRELNGDNVREFFRALG